MLEPHLQERVDPSAPAPRDGEFIVYWMRVAARATENPALDVALSMGRQLGKPVFVYHALSQRYRYASDRLHTFILEGARDVQRDLTARGIGSVFHLERTPEPVLTALAARAALVVTDFMPVNPMLAWDQTVARHAPLWRVDASCLAPLWLLTTPLTRAFEFRAAATPLWKARLARAWVDVEPQGLAFVPSNLPFTPLDLQGTSIPDLVASCDIDHAVSPVHHTVGGADAGALRWQRFLDTGLDSYARDRHDPVRAGTSRLSAYLHFGHVSVFRVARDAAARRTEGAEKFLDELLTWRELAWHFCLHEPRHETVDALPAWARESLKRHEHDPRHAMPSWEALARAQTGDALWDACQRQLLTHGELHNAVRMTWGKALLGWTKNARDALALMIDLNHRFALDGRDPASYGGVLWCLGALDRPFSPEQPIIGSVRPRPLAEQAVRLDVAEYARKTRLPSRSAPLAVAVIGAGFSGAACARTLVDAGHAVTLFDKGRGAGGRVSTRRGDDGQFDHGAQYFTVRDERFARWARAWWQERVVTEWKPRLATLGTPPTAQPGEAPLRLVAVPGMSALVTRALLDLDVRSQTQVGSVVREGDWWRLISTEGHALGQFEALVLATPAPQAAALIDPANFAFASRLREVVMEPCHAVMATFRESLGLEWDAAFSNVGPLSWLARESSKPERAPGERWVFHTTAEWSHRHLDDAPATIVAQVMDAVFASTGARRVEPAFVAQHRWRYATTSTPLGDDCLFDPATRLVACGDWCRGGRLEGAFLSGLAAGGRLNGLAGSPIEWPDEPAPRRHPAQLRLIDS
jgi:hypothetical protein